MYVEGYLVRRREGAVGGREEEGRKDRRKREGGRGNGRRGSGRTADSTTLYIIEEGKKLIGGKMIRLSNVQ